MYIIGNILMLILGFGLFFLFGYLNPYYSTDDKRPKWLTDKLSAILLVLYLAGYTAIYIWLGKNGYVSVKWLI